MEKINIELFQELKEIAEDAVSYFFKSIKTNYGSRLCLVDINCKAKPFVFDNLGKIEKFNLRECRQISAKRFFQLEMVKQRFKYFINLTLV